MLDGAGAIVATGMVEELLWTVGCEMTATLEVVLEEGCTAGLEGVLTTTNVGLWLGVLETVEEDEELLLTVLDCAAEVVVCTLSIEVEVDVGATTATVEELEVVLLGSGFPFTATSLAPQTFAFTRTSPTAFFR